MSGATGCVEKESVANGGRIIDTNLHVPRCGISVAGFLSLTSDKWNSVDGVRVREIYHSLKQVGVDVPSVHPPESTLRRLVIFCKINSLSFFFKYHRI